MVNGWTWNGDMKWPALPASESGRRSSCSRSPACCGRRPRRLSGCKSSHLRSSPAGARRRGPEWDRSIGELEGVAYGPRLRLARLQPDSYEWFWTDRLPRRPEIYLLQRSISGNLGDHSGWAMANDEVPGQPFQSVQGPVNIVPR